jgi:hypothetical protein
VCGVNDREHAPCRSHTGVSTVPQLGDSLLIPSNGGVRCPGCTATSATSASLAHHDGCPVSRLIENARVAYDLIDADDDMPVAG